MKAVNIKWDTENYPEAKGNLPTEMEIPNGMTDEDEISNYLSDQTNFLHFGFELTD